MVKRHFLELVLGIVFLLGGSVVALTGLAVLLATKNPDHVFGYLRLATGVAMSGSGLILIIRWVSALVPK